MYRKIVVPLDGSKRAETILPYVEDLALDRDCTVILLQIIEPGATMVTPYDMVPYYDSDLGEKWAKEACDYLNGIKSELREKQILVKIYVEQGPIVRRILDIADSEGADLIAMASHGRTGLARVFYGSIAAGVLQQADRPLLLVRSGVNR